MFFPYFDHKYIKTSSNRSKSSWFRISSIIPFRWCCFHVDWRASMFSEFRTRYCGHLLARLAKYGHNTTKQTTFPTTWRESLKEQTSLVITKLVWASRACTILSRRLKVGLLRCSCLVSLQHGLKGRLACLGPSYWCACLTGCTNLG